MKDAAFVKSFRKPSVPPDSWTRRDAVDIAREQLEVAAWALAAGQGAWSKQLIADACSRLEWMLWQSESRSANGDSHER
jgi:hypothetical protein